MYRAYVINRADCNVNSKDIKKDLEELKVINRADCNVNHFHKVFLPEFQAVINRADCNVNLQEYIIC